jgi:ribose transport system permease protein
MGNELTSISRKEKNMGWIAKYATLIAFVAVCLIFTLTTDNFRFIKTDNVLNVLRQISILAVVSLGMTITMAVGEMDMSVGSVVGLTCTMAMGLISNQDLSVGVTIVLVLLVGLFIGALNAAITIFCKIPSIIVTLGMQSIITGILYMYSEGRAAYGANPAFYAFIGQKRLLGIPVLVIIMVIFTAVTYFILNKTIIGRYLYATGGNQTTARLSGINTKAYKFAGMMTSAVMAAIAGILLTAKLGSGQPTAGESYTLEALSAVFIGMTTIRLGQPNVIGTIIGVALTGVLSNGLNLLGFSYFIQDMAKGLVMIAAVAISSSRTNLKLI